MVSQEGQGLVGGLVGGQSEKQATSPSPISTLPPRSKTQAQLSPPLLHFLEPCLVFQIQGSKAWCSGGSEVGLPEVVNQPCVWKSFSLQEIS